MALPDNPTIPAAKPLQPVLFLGHGSPMNAIEDNAWSRAWKALGTSLPRPKAILSVSAHWWTRGVRITAQENPPTIHDFGGFPQELFEVEYPAKGSAELVARIARILPAARGVSDWGLDHGTWSVLVHLFPQADVPVVQLSLDAESSPSAFVELGKALAPLRAEGVLIVGSGSITHNLSDSIGRMMGRVQGDAGWARRFDEAVAAATEARDRPLLESLHATADGRKSHPTPDHWFPYLVAWGATSASDTVRWPVVGMDMESMSMRAARWDAAA